MTQLPPEPWNPDRHWADLFIASLILVILVLVSGQARLRHRHAPTQTPEARVSLQGRLQDIALAAPKLLGPLGGHLLPGKALTTAAAESGPGWDRAILAIHAGEEGNLELGLNLGQAVPGPLGDLFRQGWRRCYLGEKATLSAADQQSLQQALGNGYAARILQARLQSRAGVPAQALEEAAQRWARPRVLALAAASAGGFLLALVGLGFGCFLAFRPGRPQPLPNYRLSGRAVLIVLLGWFLTLLAAGPAVGLLLSLFPFLRPIALPLVYALHAALGTWFLCRAEGVPLGALWKRLCPGNPGRAAGSGLGFFALAFTTVMAVALVLAPLLRNESPQKELLDLLANVKGPVAITLIFLTVAVLAPVYEELLFRGFLLPWLGARLEHKLGRRQGWLLAMTITALTFGAMHMQPWGLPTLSSLGFVLGLAYVRTGNLGTAILVHGLWNGGVFITMRLISS